MYTLYWRDRNSGTYDHQEDIEDFAEASKRYEAMRYTPIKHFALYQDDKPLYQTHEMKVTN